jgi:hypothetical protein
MNQTQTITEVTTNDLKVMLLNLRGATFCTFTANTIPKSLKRNRITKEQCPYENIVKVQTINAVVNFHYDEGVIRRLEKEGKSTDDFRRGESWHEPVIMNGRLTPFCQHKQNGELYLRVMHKQHVGSIRYFNIDSEGKKRELSYGEVEDYLPIPDKTHENQGLEEPLIFLTFKLAGIKRMSIAGQVFEVSEPEFVVKERKV